MMYATVSEIKPETPADALEVALTYARAKSRQDIAGALACCGEDFIMEAPAFGTFAIGRAEVARDLEQFFAAFPDYGFVSEGSALGEDGAVVLWGRFQATSSGRIGVLRLPRRRVDLPATAVLATRGGLLRHESFLFDGITLANQLGLPAWPLRAGVELESGRVPIDETIVIEAPLAHVFERAFADVSQMMRASPKPPLPRATRIELVGAPEIQRGAIRRVHLSTGHVTDEEITAFEPPVRMAYRIVNGWGAPFDALISDTRGEHLLSPHPRGTQVRWRGAFTLRHRAALPAVQGLRAAVVRPFFRRFLRSVKGDIEAGRL